MMPAWTACRLRECGKGVVKRMGLRETEARKPRYYCRRADRPTETVCTQRHRDGVQT